VGGARRRRLANASFGAPARPARYRLGFARSLDGETWVRRDAELGLDVSPGEWDGDAIAYGTEVVAGGRTWLFYNGDDFGGTGVGVAELLEG
jgi:hypothetical protein